MVKLLGQSANSLILLHHVKTGHISRRHTFAEHQGGFYQTMYICPIED